MDAVHGVAIQILPLAPMVIPGQNAKFRPKNSEKSTPKNPVSRCALGGRGKPVMQQIQTLG
jgi:hypothetical protein